MAINASMITPGQRWLITLGVMAATLMQVVDTTIVNVALPHMQGALGTTSDEISWVLTSYLVSSGIIMPLTGYFDDRLSTKKYLFISVLGFVIASILCGMATSLTEMVVFRILQGCFGAALVPLAQAILIDIYPKEDRGKALAIWGVGVMIGPVLGPTLGGYITDVATWRWIFYVNVPVGLLSLLLISYALPPSDIRERRMDWLGLLFLSLGIMGLQYFLDRGNHDDWFDSRGICIAAFLAMAGFLSFIFYSLTKKNRQIQVFDLKIFKDRNFTISSILLAMFGLGLYGGMVILPLMLENLLNYPVLTTGLVMAPRGLSGMVAMLFVGKLIKIVDPRKLILVGIILTVIGSAACRYYSFNIDPWWIIWPLLFQGFGLGMIFVPLSAVAFSTLPEHQRVDATGVFSLLRTLGSSIGIALVITVFTQHTQISWQQLGEFVHPYNHAVTNYLQPLHLHVNQLKGAAVIAQEVFRQAQMLAFYDSFTLIAWSMAAMLPLLFLLRKGK